MCIVFFAFGCDPPHPKLILAFNRDEYFQRPTQALHAWEDGNGVLAGRDLEGGGTWLGVNSRTGRVAFLTNLRSRDPVEPSTHVQKMHTSRGELPTRFLNGNSTPTDFVQSLNPEQYHGFNLVVGDVRRDPRDGAFAYINNGRDGANGDANGGPGCSTGEGRRPAAGFLSSDEGLLRQSGGDAGGVEPAKECGPADDGTGDRQSAASLRSTASIQILHPGRVYGLSNGVLMEWPKVAAGIQLMADLLPDIREDSVVPWDRLFGDLLGDKTRLVPPSLTQTQAPFVMQCGQQPAPPPPQPSPSSVAGSGSAASAPQSELCSQAQAGRGNGAEPVANRSSAPQSECPKQERPIHDKCADLTKDMVEEMAAHGSPEACKAAGDPVEAVEAVEAVALEAAGGPGRQVDTESLARYAKELAHLTSGRFVEVIDSPFGPYGTRSQTVILVRHDGSAEMRERHLGQDGAWKETALTFQLEQPEQAGPGDEGPRAGTGGVMPQETTGG